MLCLSSGEANSVFPADLFSRKSASLLERAKAEGGFFFRRRFSGFTITRSVTSLASLALLDFFGAKTISHSYRLVNCTVS